MLLTFQQFCGFAFGFHRHCQRRQFHDRVQAEVLQEFRRGRIQDRAPRSVGATRFKNQAFTQQAFHHAIAVNSTDRIHLRAGNRLLSGKFDLEDFLKQMQQMKRLGPVTKLLEMIPGMGQMMAGVDMENAEGDLKRIEAIIYSMTPAERRDPAILKASRKRRVAAGSGTSVQEINVLLKQFREMQTMMKQIRDGGGRTPNMLSRLMGQMRGRM